MVDVRFDGLFRAPLPRFARRARLPHKGKESAWRRLTGGAGAPRDGGAGEEIGALVFQMAGMALDSTVQYRTPLGCRLCE